MHQRLKLSSTASILISEHAQEDLNIGTGQRKPRNMVSRCNHIRKPRRYCVFLRTIQASRSSGFLTSSQYRFMNRAASAPLMTR